MSAFVIAQEKPLCFSLSSLLIFIDLYVVICFYVLERKGYVLERKGFFLSKTYNKI